MRESVSSFISREGGCISAHKPVAVYLGMEQRDRERRYNIAGTSTGL